MVDVALTISVVVILVFAIVLRSFRQPRELRPLMWIALAEYLVCAAVEYGFAVDATRYKHTGIELAKFLDASFGWASKEVLLLLIQQPSAFDRVVQGAGSNTGSMSAATALLMFAVRSSDYAAQALIAGFALFGALAVYDAFRDACPGTSPRWLFAATVLFPSIAFWTSALHKEAFCLIGTGFLFAGWKAARHRRLRALAYAPLGLLIIGLFRAPVLPPLVLGLVVYFVVGRIQKARGAAVAVVAPAYLALGLAASAVGMIVIAHIAPNLALDQLSETVADHQAAWAVTEGGSALDTEAPIDQTLGAQLASAPLALLNALFRPQLFDVKNPLILVSALEMTAVTFLIIRSFWLHGLGGLVRRIQSSPFIAMCTVVTIIGCTFVGLTTRNLGSMARYRVPFLPFYGALLAVLAQRAPQRAVSVTRARRPPPNQKTTLARQAKALLKDSS